MDAQPVPRVSADDDPDGGVTVDEPGGARSDGDTTGRDGAAVVLPSREEAEPSADGWFPA